MDQIINKIAEENRNPALREELVHDLFNSPVGRRFESAEALDAALTEGKDAQVIAAARQRLGLPVIK
jgi:hypothetical protein